MLPLKDHFGYFCIRAVFACLLTKSLLAKDFPHHSFKNIAKDDFLYKYNESEKEYTYLDDEPLDISLELDSYNSSQKNCCKFKPNKVQTDYCDCKTCRSEQNYCQYHTCKFHCCKKNKTQKYFSLYKLGKIAPVIYVLYKTRNIIKVTIRNTIFMVDTLNSCFRKMDYENLF